MQIKIGNFTEQATPHRLGLSPEAVFSNQPAIFYRQTRPLLTVDLRHICPAWRGMAHFLYCHTDYHLEFHLEEERYVFRQAYRMYKPTPAGKVLDPRSIQLDPAALFEPDEEYGNDLTNLPLEASGYLELHEIATPEFSHANKYAWAKEMRQRRAELGALLYITPKERTLQTSFHTVEEFMFAPEPFWLQQPEPPRNPDGELMSFVGQVNANLFSSHAVDLWIYLFYCEKHQIVTQVTQCS